MHCITKVVLTWRGEGCPMSPHLCMPVSVALRKCLFYTPNRCLILYYSTLYCVRHECSCLRSGFKCCLLTQSLHIPSETCASLQLTVTPNVSPPHYLSGRQQVFCDLEIRESWKDGAPPELDCLCRRRENLCFHFQSISSRLSHPQITAAPVQYTYVTCWRLLLADRGLFSCTCGQRRQSSAPSTVSVHVCLVCRWYSSVSVEQRLC